VGDLDRQVARAERAFAARDFAKGFALLRPTRGLDLVRHAATVARAREASGRAFAQQQRFHDAERDLALAVKLERTAPRLAALAAVMWPGGRYAERLKLLEEAVALAPDVAEYRAHRAEMLLTVGRWAEAWPDYERRHDVKGFDHATGCQTLGLPQWMGEPLDGRTIIVVHEGGYGDAMNFARYGPLLKQRGAGRTILRVPKTLVPLLRPASLFDDVVDNDAMPPIADVEVALMSLPARFRTTPETIPWSGPYLQTSAKQSLPKGAIPRIGFVWQGAPHNPTDGVRSIPPVELANFLLTRPLGQWVSLQGGSDWHRMLGPVRGFDGFVEWPTITGDWTETAALLRSVDLLVSVDTAIVHCAGAMGVPTWLLTASSNDWRWLTDTERTAWYPSIRILRMRRPNDWAGLLRQVGTDLRTEYARQ
jgi:hypothetical protein